MEKEEFVKDFSEFFGEIKKEGVEASVQDIAMLYAIYRKDLRADRLNGSKANGTNGKLDDPSKEPATERQKHYLMDLRTKRACA